MYHRQFVAAFILFAAISLGNCLKCHSCKGDLDSDCAKGVMSTEKYCEDFPLPPRFKNFNLSYLEKRILATLSDIVDEHACIEVARKVHTPYVTRSCFYDSKQDPVCPVLAELGELSLCRTCFEDFCNNNEIN